MSSKRVLVTGGTGFIGHHVVSELLKRDLEVIVTGRSLEKARSQSWFHQVTFIEHDLNDLEAENLWEKFQFPETLIHLAWDKLDNFKDSWHINQGLSHHYHFLSNLLMNGLTDITSIGTCLEYGLQEGSLHEGLESRPVVSYAISKNLLYQKLSQLKEKKTFHLKWIRPFYLYGPGQSRKSLLSCLEKAIEEGEISFKMSPGDQLRDYLPVSVAAENIVHIALQNAEEGIINCCSGRPIQIKDLVAEHLKKLNSDIILELGHYPYPNYEPKHFWGDTTRLKRITHGSN